MHNRRVIQRVIAAICLPALSLLLGCSPGVPDDTEYVLGGIEASFKRDSAWLISRRGKLLRVTCRGTYREITALSGVGAFHKVSFIDDQNGWAIYPGGECLHSTDSGTSWTKVGSLRGYESEEFGGGVRQFVFMDQLHGWIVTAWFIWRTNDGGATWTWRGVEETARSCSFLGTDTVWLLGSEGGLYHSEDAGESWVKRSSVPRVPDPGEIRFVDPHNGWLQTSGANGLLRTTDGGYTWLQGHITGSDYAVDSFDFPNQNLGWGAGQVEQPEPYDWRDNRHSILRTMDGGVTWEVVGTILEPALVATAIRFLDSNSGWLLAEHEKDTKLYRTEDGGHTWDAVLTIPETGI